MFKRRLMVIVAIIGTMLVTLCRPIVVAADDVFCSGSNSVNTALGCVPVEYMPFTAWLLTWVFGVAGGIAFLLTAYVFILMATSSGDPKAVQGAQETVTSAITGLLISIFALFLLRLIAVNILHIPGIN